MEEKLIKIVEWKFCLQETVKEELKSGQPTEMKIYKIESIEEFLLQTINFMEWVQQKVFLDLNRIFI